MRKLLFWAITGGLSAFCGEVMTGSSPHLLFDPFGLIVTLPLYALHMIVIVNLIYILANRFALSALYFGGILFGLYEAYITKVIWLPHWNPDAIRVAGVALFETTILLLFSHPILSLIIPFFVAISVLLTRPPAVLMRPLSLLGHRVILVIIAIYLGVMNGGAAYQAFGGNFVAVIALAFLNVVIVVAVVIFWRRWGLRKDLFFGDVALSRPQLGVCFVALIAYYGVLTPLLRPEALPGWDGHIAVVFMYGAAFAGLMWTVRTSRRIAEFEVKAVGHVMLPREAMRLAVVFVCAAAFVAAAVPGIYNLSVAAGYVVGSAIGIVMLIRCSLWAIRGGTT